MNAPRGCGPPLSCWAMRLEEMGVVGNCQFSASIDRGGSVDAGIWEFRNGDRVQAFSTLMCWAAADRATSMHLRSLMDARLSRAKSNNLVNAMASFAPPAPSQSSLPQANQGAHVHLRNGG